MQETSDNLRAETRGQYAARRRAWLAVTDHESVRAVVNVLPEEFRQRVESGTLDRSLLTKVNGGLYEVPLFYVTKAWDTLLTSDFFLRRYLHDADLTDEHIADADLTDEDLAEYSDFYGATRTPCEMCRDNRRMKRVWRDLLGIDIDAPAVDFSLYGQHLGMDEDEYYEYFHDVPDGIWERTLYNIFVPSNHDTGPDDVSDLMELMADWLASCAEDD